VNQTATSGPLPVLQLGEIVLRTGGYEAMKHWYRQILQIDPHLEHVPTAMPTAAVTTASQPWASQVRLCFFRLVLQHPYQQVVALFEVPGTTAATTEAAGLHHLQLRDASRTTLAQRYRLLRGLDIVPYRAMDHGPTSSLYYRDPDGNTVEIAVPNSPDPAQFLTAEAAEEYRRNPSGQILDMARFLEATDGR
jgi:catechol 2,3-dioxygenase-like lactoylglutathione lyase family enzyme